MIMPLHPMQVEDTSRSAAKSRRPKQRISHTKSRNGCYTCKQRRVKVITDTRRYSRSLMTDTTSVTRSGQRAVHVSFGAKTASTPIQEAHVTRQGDNHPSLDREYRLRVCIFKRVKPHETYRCAH